MMRKPNLLIMIILVQFLVGGLVGQDSKAFRKFLAEDPQLAPILKKKKKYGIQILYSEWKDSTRTGLHSVQFGLDESTYFYPASTIKLPMAVLALEKCLSLGLKGDEAVQFISSNSEYPSMMSDSSSTSGEASILHFIKKIFLVSDNDAFNRLYDFVGRESFNKRMAELGFKGTWVNHRLSILLSEEAQRSYPELRFSNGLVIKNSDSLHYHRKTIFMGKAYIKNDERIEEPMEFSRKNEFILGDQQRFVEMLFFPDLFPENQRLKISEEQRAFVKQYMGMYLSESENPSYPKDWDALGKYFVFGARKGHVVSPLRIYNKIGGAYGFLIDNAYIVDEVSKAEFFLSAVIYVNENKTFNDNTYEYDSIGYPFMAALGKRCLAWAMRKEHQ